eukprot:g21233.t1
MATAMTQPPVLEALREDVALAERLAEQRRQDLVRARNQEDRQLRTCHAQQREEEHQERAATRRVLDEMRQVRQKVHGQLRAAQAHAFHSTDDHALVRAGKRALTARKHQEQWEAQASWTEKQMQLSIVQDKELLKNIQEAASQRVASMDSVAQQRVEKSQQLLHFSKEQDANLRLHQDEIHQTQLRQAVRNSKIKVDSAHRAADRAQSEMIAAEAKALTAQQRMTRDVERSLQAGAARISTAERQLKVEEEEMKAALWREEICALQIKRVAQEWKDNVQVEFQERKQELEKVLERVSDYEHRKKMPHQDAQVSMQIKTEEVSSRGFSVAQAARTRASPGAWSSTWRHGDDSPVVDAEAKVTVYASSCQ